MTQEDKELLMKDLCARVPYGVVVSVKEMFGSWKKAPYNIDSISRNGFVKIPADFDWQVSIEEVKPYLYHIRSLDESQLDKLQSLQVVIYNGDIVEIYNTEDSIDWLNEHHVDYRGLIEKGLAIAVTEENNPYKKQNTVAMQIVPKNLEEAFSTLDKILSDEEKKFLLKEDPIAVHFSIGTFIRNNWGFWEYEENKLKNWLHKKGFVHPDDMSNYIIEQYVEYLNKEK